MSGTTESCRRDIPLDKRSVLRVECVNEAVFRLRLSPDGQFREGGLVRYGIVRTDWPECAVSVTENADAVALSTAAANFSLQAVSREMEGAADGAAEGAELGAPEGLLVGVSVCPALDGEALGTHEGGALGSPDGSPDGAAEGKLLG